MHMRQSILPFSLLILFFSLNSFSGVDTSSTKTTPPAKAKTPSAGTSTYSSNKAPTPRKKTGKSKASSKTAKGSVHKIRGQKEIEPSRVMEIQSALAGAGFFRGEPTGQWDQATIEAMRSYQQTNGYRTTGKPDALSLKKLGL
jgi:peptidoglycan hydrolase-like protein with peptidoglycan-binding domain